MSEVQKPVGERLSRFTVPALDAILGMPMSVLDTGHVRLIDYMGGDEAIVQAARVSYGKGTKKVHEDQGLIRYLMRHYHTTPFEMCEIKLHVKVPMDHWRQWIRHRTANVNEYSTRYSEAIDDTAATAPTKWRFQSGRNKQGSSGYLPEDQGLVLSEGEKVLHSMLRAEYEKRLAMGVAKEQARKDLSLSTYTEAYWKVDLHNLLHFLRLRMDPHAQEEIRSYATTIGEMIVQKWVPMTWDAFRDYRLDALMLTRLDVEIIKSIGHPPTATAKAKAFGWLEMDGGKLKGHREREEFEVKASRLGLSVPWAA